MFKFFSKFFRLALSLMSIHQNHCVLDIHQYLMQCIVGPWSVNHQYAFCETVNSTTRLRFLILTRPCS